MIPCFLLLGVAFESCMESFVLPRRGKRKETEISRRGRGKDRGRDQREEVFQRGENWVSGHCNGMDGPLAAGLGGSWVHADCGPSKLPCHQSVDEGVSESPSDQGQLTTYREIGPLSP